MFNIPGNDERRGLIAIEDCVELAIKSEKRLIEAARRDKLDGFEAGKFWGR